MIRLHHSYRLGQILHPPFSKKAYGDLPKVSESVRVHFSVRLWLSVVSIGMSVYVLCCYKTSVLRLHGIYVPSQCQ